MPKKRDLGALTKVLIAEPLKLPIPRGLAGPGILADTIVKRSQDHMPLNRLEDMSARDGVELARSTMRGWHGALAEIAKPLVSAMREDAFAQTYLCTRRDRGTRAAEGALPPWPLLGPRCPTARDLVGKEESVEGRLLLLREDETLGEARRERIRCVLARGCVGRSPATLL
ncbi:MAG: transposase [Labilithrix sp.]|nr:transposase [Labilithrix sp.]